MPRSLDEIILFVAEQNDARGALLFGSQAWGVKHEWSDIDLVCLAKGNTKERFLCQVDGIDVDVYLAPEADLMTAIKTDCRDNNNFILYACAKGRIILDDLKTLASLTEVAREVWRAGPVPPSPAEQGLIAYGMDKAARAANSLCRKATLSDDWDAITAVQRDYLFLGCVSSYCRAKRLWSSAIWEILRWDDPAYSELQGFCRGYFKAKDFVGKVRLLEALANQTRSVLSAGQVALPGAESHFSTEALEVIEESVPSIQPPPRSKVWATLRRVLQ